MSEAQARRHLRRMLRSQTPGSVLSLLADVFREFAQEAKREKDLAAYRRFTSVEQTLIVVGLGIDATVPQ